MLPWRNWWFQIAFFAWLVSGALLIVDYAPKIPTNISWTTPFERAPKQSSEVPAKPSPPSEQQSPLKQPAPARPAPGPSPETPGTKAPKASGTNSGSAEFAQGKATYDRKDFVQAMQWFQKAAALGNADAEAYLGNLYQYGAGVQKNSAEAMNWYQKAAAQRNARAAVVIGLLYGLQKNDPEAVRWYQKAAARGDDFASLRLAELRARKNP